MKSMIVILSLASFAAFALDPEPTLHNPDQDRLQNSRSHDGALKIEKKPVHIEGLTSPPKDQLKEKKAPKKKDKK